MNSLLNCVQNVFCCFSELLFTILQSQSILLPLNFNIFKTLGFFFCFSNFLIKLCFTGSLLPPFGIPDEPPCYVRQCELKCIYVPCLYVCMVLGCLGVWLHIYWSCDALSLHNSTGSSGSLVFTHLGKIKEACT